jgi:hypothetical protein
MKRQIFLSGIVAMSLSFGLLGCGGGSGSGSKGANVSATQLRSTPTQVSVGDKTILGDVALWRNLMPGPDVGPRGVIATFTLKAGDGGEIASSTTIQKVQLVNGETVWVAPSLEFPDASSRKSVTVRDAPEWAVGSSVDVVVDFVENNGQTHQVRAVGNVVVGAY